METIKNKKYYLLYKELAVKPHTYIYYSNIVAFNNSALKCNSFSMYEYECISRYPGTIYVCFRRFKHRIAITKMVNYIYNKFHNDLHT